MLKYAERFRLEWPTYHIVIAFETLTDAQILGKCFEIQA